MDNLLTPIPGTSSRSFSVEESSAAAYASVAKWTSKYNLFDKKYIVIPINEK